jgi:predicted lipid carrier protein YhbT
MMNRAAASVLPASSASPAPSFMRPLSMLANHLPHPGSAAFAAGLNLVLRRDLPHDVYQQLIGRHVEIAVSNWGMRFRFAVTASRFIPLGQGAAIDLCITATARDFALLASGEEDADTLYFEQRAVVEGDTELALLIKNTLDALPAKRTRKVIRGLHRGMDRVRAFKTRRTHSTGR